MPVFASRVVGSMAVAGWLLTAAPASAYVTFCNEFNHLIYVAIAYPQDDGSWLSRGWMSLDPHECLPFDTALHLKTVYYRAASAPYRDARAKRGTYTWGKGDRAFAVWEDDNFNYWTAEKRVLNSRLEPFTAGPTTDDPEGLDVTITFEEGNVITSLKGNGAPGGSTGGSHQTHGSQD